MNHLNSDHPVLSGSTAVFRKRITTPVHQNYYGVRLFRILSVLLFIAMLFSTKSNAQSITPCTTATNVAFFSADGDLYANYPPSLLQLNDDWFQRLDLYPGNGIGVIGTGPLTSVPAGMSADDFKALILAPGSNRNYTYVQRM